MVAERIEMKSRTARRQTVTEATLTMTWSRETVPLEAIERALYVVADRASGTIGSTEEQWCTELHVRPDVDDLDAFMHLLRSEVNDQTLRLRIAERTDSIRNLVFALAFSRSGLIETEGSR